MGITSLQIVYSTPRNRCTDMLRVLGFVLLLFFSFTSFAFMQGMRRLTDGTILSIEKKDAVIPRGYTLIHPNEKLVKRLDSLCKNTKSKDHLSDYAMVLIVNGRYEEAKEIYLKSEKMFPGNYATSANLGTVYELLGDNKRALEWIRKSVQLHTTSRDSSEWLQMKILEAKINGDRFINSDFILGVNFGRDSLPSSSLSQNQLIQLRKYVFSQLTERLTFYQPEDKIVAQLLFDLANLSLLTGAQIYAVNDVYSMAKSYGYSGALFERRSNCVKNLSLKINNGQVDVKEGASKVSSINFSQAVILGCCFLLFPIFAFLYLYRRMKTHNL